jgi:hypothetical protein
MTYFKPIFWTVIFMCSSVWAAGDRIGVLTEIMGTVLLDGKQIKGDAAIFKGSQIETKIGKATLMIGMDSIVHLGLSTKMNIDEALLKEKSTTLHMEHGSTRALVKADSKSDSRVFRIRSRAATMGVRGTHIYLETPQDPKQPQTFATIEGKAVVTVEAPPTTPKGNSNQADRSTGPTSGNASPQATPAAQGGGPSSASSSTTSGSTSNASSGASASSTSSGSTPSTSGPQQTTSADGSKTITLSANQSMQLAAPTVSTGGGAPPAPAIMLASMTSDAAKKLVAAVAPPAQPVKSTEEVKSKVEAAVAAAKPESSNQGSGQGSAATAGSGSGGGQGSGQGSAIAQGSGSSSGGPGKGPDAGAPMMPPLPMGGQFSQFDPPPVIMEPPNSPGPNGSGAGGVLGGVDVPVTPGAAPAGQDEASPPVVLPPVKLQFTGKVI